MTLAKEVSAAYIKRRAELSPRDRAAFDAEITTFIRVYPELSKSYRDKLLDELLHSGTPHHD